MKRHKSNIQKQFEKHAELTLRSFADGGLVSNRMRAMERLAGATPGTVPTPTTAVESVRAAAAPAPTPAPAAPAAPAEPMSVEEIAFRQKYNMMPGQEKPGIFDTLRKKIGFADGGYVDSDEVTLRYADGGPVYGPLSTGREPAGMFASDPYERRTVRAASMPVPARLSENIATDLVPSPTIQPESTPGQRLMASRPAERPGVDWNGTLRHIKSFFFGSPADKPVYANMIGVRGADGGATEDLIERAGLRGAIRAGVVEGPIKGKDSVDAKLMPGEYVLPTDTVREVGKKKLDRLVKKTHKPKPPEETELHMANGGLVLRKDVPGSDFFNDQMEQARISLRDGNIARGVGKAVRGVVAAPFVAAGEAGHRVITELAPVGRAMTNFASGIVDSDNLRTLATPPARQQPVAAPVSSPVVVDRPGGRAGDEIDMNSPRSNMTSVGGGVSRIDDPGRSPVFTNVPNDNSLDVGNPVGVVPAGADPVSVLGLRGGGVQRVSAENGGVSSPELSAALAAASARGDHEAVRDFYQRNGGTFRGTTAEQDIEREALEGLRRSPRGRARLAGVMALKDQNAAIRERTAANTRIAAARAQQEQANKDREYALDVQRFGVEAADKNRAAREATEKALQSNLEARFRTRDKDGKNIVDHGKIAEFRTALDTTIPQIVQQLEAVGSPEAVAKARQLRERGVAALEPSDIEGLHQLFNIRERMRQAKGAGPNQGTFADSDNLFDYRQTGLDKRTFGGNRIVTKAGSVSANDLRYRDGIANAILPDLFKTEDLDLLRGLRIK